MNSFYDFLNQSGVTTNEVRLVIRRDCVWKKTKERGMYVYGHFLGADCESINMFVCENGGIIIPLPVDKESLTERFSF